MTMMMPVAPYEALRVTQSTIDGAVTTPTSVAGAPISHDSFLTRVWRFAAGSGAHAKAVDGAPY
jgi:hypothetical protein